MEIMYRSIWLSGPMRGYHHFNYPAFHSAAARLRRDGWNVVSPAEMAEEAGFDPETATFDDELETRDYMAVDLPKMLHCECIAALAGWDKSAGASIEIFVGQACGLRVLDAVTMNPLPSAALLESHRRLESRPEESMADRRRRLLETVAGYVCQSRSGAYGEPEDSFQAIADMANVAMRDSLSKGKLTSRDVAIFGICLKLARLSVNPEHLDSWMDACGYAVCGAGLVEGGAS